MSDYRYYEFRSIDRPLDSTEIRMLRRLSTRASITPHGFTNHYDYGDFKGDCNKLIAETFDAFVFTSDHFRRFSLRLPKKRLRDPEAVLRFAGDCTLFVYELGESIIVDVLCEDIEPDFETPDASWMQNLEPLRESLLNGDLRCLYLGWLLQLACNEIDEEDPEPPVPPGLGSLDWPLRMFAEFVHLDRTFIEAAAEASAKKDAEPSDADVAAWVDAASSEEKDELLRAAAVGEIPDVPNEIRRRIRAVAGGEPSAQSGARTAGEIRARRNAVVEQREKEEERRRLEQARRRKEREAELREKRLESLKGREEDLWDEIGDLIETTRPKDYDQAVFRILELRDLAKMTGTQGDFVAALHLVREENSNRPSFLRRLDEAGLVLKQEDVS